MALHLLDTVTLLHSFNGHILGIFLNVHVILLGQRECATDQTGLYFQTVLFVHLVEGHGTHLMTPRPDGCVARSSRIFVLPPEAERRWMSSTFAPGVGFIRRLVFAILRRPIRRWCPQQLPYTSRHRRAYRLPLKRIVSVISQNKSKKVRPPVVLSRELEPEPNPNGFSIRNITIKLHKYVPHKYFIRHMKSAILSFFLTA